MARKPVKQAKRMHKPVERKPVTPDPTPEEIWGTADKIGLAETIRMERPEHPQYASVQRLPMIRECSTKMLPGGKGVLRGQG